MDTKLETGFHSDQSQMLFHSLTEELEDSERRLRLAMQAAGMYSWEMDVPTGEIKFSGDVRGVIGFSYTEEDDVFSRIGRYTVPEDGLRHQEALRRTMRGEGDLHSVNRVINPETGAVVWLETHATLVRTEDGSPQRVVGIAQNITGRKQTEEALRKSEEKFRSFMQASFSAIYRMSADWSVMLELHGKDFLEDTDSPDPLWLSKYIHPLDQAHVLDVIHEAIRTKGIFKLEHRVIQADGSIGWTHSQAIPVMNDKGEIIEWLGTASDITERKKTQEALETATLRLERSYDLLSGILENTTGLIAAVDTDFNYLAVNEAYRRECKNIYGVDINKGDNLMETLAPYPDDQRISREIFASAFHGKSVVTTQSYGDPDKSRRTYELHVSPIRDSQGCIIGAAHINTDITARKQAEELLKKNNESLEKTIEMKDEFLSLISHEFRTPLTVIISAVQMLKTFAWDELSEKAKGYCNTIRQNSNRQLKLVNNILDITKVNAGRFDLHMTNSDIVQLTKYIIESIVPYVDRKKIKASFSFDPAEMVIGVDEEKYERILLNLLSNAIKYTPKGQSVSVRLSKKTVRNKAMVCVQVCDNGLGIPADKLEHIFERFGQADGVLSRQAEGTGIGLHLTRMFVEMLGGEISVDSQLGMGSTFTVLIPAVKMKEAHLERMVREMDDNRIIQLTEIEFSDIYLDK